MEEKFNKTKNKILQMLTNQLNGTLYEIYVYNYLKNNNIECWLWNFVPIHILYKSKYINKDIYNKFINEEIIFNPLPDKGIDLIAIYDSKYVFIQCKNYKGILGNTKLNTYFNIMSKCPYNMGLIFYSNKICSNINKTIKNIEYVHIPFDNYENNKSINKYTNKIQETIDKNINKYPSIVKLYKNEQKTTLITNYSLNKFNHNIQEINEYYNNKLNDYLYSDLKWEYILHELDDYIKLNNKLPDLCDNSHEKIHNFINYNDKINNKYTEEWKKYKETHHNIFIN